MATQVYIAYGFEHQPEQPPHRTHSSMPAQPAWKQSIQSQHNKVFTNYRVMEISIVSIFVWNVKRNE